MATLQQYRPSSADEEDSLSQSLSSVNIRDPSTEPVPTPFPSRRADALIHPASSPSSAKVPQTSYAPVTKSELERTGRSAFVTNTSGGPIENGSHLRASSSNSRSPGGSSKLGGLVEKVKRAISQSRDRASINEEGSRARRGSSVDPSIREEEVPRGRSAGVGMGVGSVVATASTIPLTQTQTNTTTTTTTTTTSQGYAPAILTNIKSRSQSRGRSAQTQSSGIVLQSTGRGGAGNMIRSPSRSRTAANVDLEKGGNINDGVILEAGEEPESEIQRAREEREKERSLSRNRNGRPKEEIVTSGRGGQGNMRNRSRDAVKTLKEGEDYEIAKMQRKKAEELERQKEIEVEMRYRQKEKEKGPKVISTGRGGAGNFWC